MTEIIPFWMAMKYESEGKTVQYEYDHTPNIWNNFTEKTCTNFPETLINRCRWRIKPEPVKYSVDIWLNKMPGIKDGCYYLDTFLFGDNISYRKDKDERCDKKFRITVEECIE